MDIPHVHIEEIRIDLRDAHNSHFYVLIRGDLKDNWHYKSFPQERSPLDVVKDWQRGLLHPVQWPIVEYA